MTAIAANEPPTLKLIRHHPCKRPAIKPPTSRHHRQHPAAPSPHTPSETHTLARAASYSERATRAPASLRLAWLRYAASLLQRRDAGVTVQSTAGL